MNSLVWFRNDLRVEDNTSLVEACKQPGKVIGAYCFDPRHFMPTTYGFRKTEKYRAKFLIECVTELKKNLLEQNISLIICLAMPEQALTKIVREHDISHIFCQLEWTFEEKLVADSIKTSLPQVLWHESYDQFLFHPADIPYASFSLIPEVFTHFRKSCEDLASVRPTVKIKPRSQDNKIADNSCIPSLEVLGFQYFKIHPNAAFTFMGGESTAKQRVKDYFFTTQRLSTYKQTRNGLLGSDYSSKFSAWLASGSLSARTIYREVSRYEREINKNEGTYWMIFELIWRDYFKYISLKHGKSLFKLEGIRGRLYQWDFNQDIFNDWIEGNTKESFVNANMIELLNTGFMSNRGRQNVASYWSKELCQDWRIGAAYFESLLIDYDVHSNYGNWLYSSGVGNDPRDRKFNIQSQASRYDSGGAYQTLWLSSKNT